MTDTLTLVVAIVLADQVNPVISPLVSDGQ
jgi:hypothetical protein